MRTIRVSGVASLTILLALSLWSGASSPDKEECAVYSAVIQKIYVRPDIKRLVIDDQTEIYSYDRAKLNVAVETKSIRKAFAAWLIEEDTVENYFAANKAPSRLQNYFTFPVPTILLTRKERYDLLHDPRGLDYWTIFYERYPNSTGILTLSRVGFNRTMRQAFVYIANSCGSLCGGGEYYLLSKKNGAWKVQAVFRLWVS